MIRRSLNSSVLLVIDQFTRESNPTPITTILSGGNPVNFYKLSSRSLNDVIKKVFNKVIQYHPAHKYPLSIDLFADIRISWQQLWQIKNPTLRAIRLKILYKDVWCQEKRFKLGINNSDSCTICGQTESAIHQLFQCNNAKRLWSYAYEILGLSFNDQTLISNLEIVNLIQVSSDLIAEVIKSVIFKLLIQIDRSVNISRSDALRTIAYWLTISEKSINRKIKGNNTFTIKLGLIMSKLILTSKK